MKDPLLFLRNPVDVKGGKLCYAVSHSSPKLRLTAMRKGVSYVRPKGRGPAKPNSR